MIETLKWLGIAAVAGLVLVWLVICGVIIKSSLQYKHERKDIK